MIHKTLPIKTHLSGENAKLTTYVIDRSGSFKINKRPLILICPGGGYEFVSDREAEIFALQFNAMGYHAAVLTYSVAPCRYPTQLFEAAQAWKIIRENAEQWNVLCDKIIILGCSAGGHLACSYSLFGSQKEFMDYTGLTAEELRPAGMILCYPVITSGEFAHQGSFAALLGNSYDKLAENPLLEKMSLEKQITESTPPAFIWHTFTDNVVPSENSLMLAAALKAKNISCELHIFPDGGHGLCLANELSQDASGYGIQSECQIWIKLVQVWLNNKYGLGE